MADSTLIKESKLKIQIYCTERNITLIMSVKMYNLKKREISDILQSNWPTSFKNVKDIQDKESEELFRNKKTKEM